jgi:hypothetical protein
MRSNLDYVAYGHHEMELDWSSHGYLDQRLVHPLKNALIAELIPPCSACP